MIGSVNIHEIATVIGYLLVGFNSFLAVKLMPILFKIESMSKRLDAIEKIQDQRTVLIERFYRVENEIPHLRREMIGINNKLDIILNNLKKR